MAVLSFAAALRLTTLGGPYVSCGNVFRAAMLFSTNLCLSTTFSQDAVQTDGDKYKTIFENDWVRVLDYRDTPGEKTHQHKHPAFVLTRNACGRFNRCRAETREARLRMTSPPAIPELHVLSGRIQSCVDYQTILRPKFVLACGA